MTLEEARRRHPGAAEFRFGDGRELCDRLLALVRSGAKTATCQALQVYESGAEEMPKVRFSNVTTAAGIDFRHVNGAVGGKLLPEPGSADEEAWKASDEQIASA